MSILKKLSPRIKLVLMLGLFMLPMAASYLTFYLWPPARSMNYGELLQAGMLPDVSLPSLDGNLFNTKSLRGNWVLLQVDAGACDSACAQKLYVMRQLRSAQGKQMERIERVFLIDDHTVPPETLRREYAGTYFLRAHGSPLLAALPVATQLRDHIYLIDPLGNLILRYPANADPRRMSKDLVRLLQVSQIG
jgi:cytochrome oxidase Cu insertion factor (SCO1/SenC/PrrC family)